MTEPLLDRLDRDPGGARRFVANLLGQGATNAQVADAILARFGESVTPRSVTTWRNKDPELRELIADLAAIKRTLAADDDTNPADLLRPQINRAQVDDDLFTLAEEQPAFAVLLLRDADREEATPTTVWGEPLTDDPPANDAPVVDDDALAVLAADHESDEAFAADCAGRLTDDERDGIAHLLAAV